MTFTQVGEWSPAGTLTGLHIRGGPGYNFRQLEDPDILDTGESADVIGVSRNGAWYKINVGNRSGWIVSGYANLSGDRNANLPVIGN